MTIRLRIMLRHASQGILKKPTCEWVVDLMDGGG